MPTRTRPRSRATRPAAGAMSSTGRTRSAAGRATAAGGARPLPPGSGPGRSALHVGRLRLLPAQHHRPRRGRHHGAEPEPVHDLRAMWPPLAPAPIRPRASSAAAALRTSGFGLQRLGPGPHRRQQPGRLRSNPASCFITNPPPSKGRDAATRRGPGARTRREMPAGTAASAAVASPSLVSRTVAPGRPAAHLPPSALDDAPSASRPDRYGAHFSLSRCQVVAVPPRRRSAVRRPGPLASGGEVRASSHLPKHS